MQHAQRFFVHLGEQGAIRLTVAREDLEGLDVPVGHFIPQEVVDDPPGFAKVELAQQSGHFGGHRGQSAGDPAFGQRRFFPPRGRWLQGVTPLLGGGGGHHEAADVPQLVHEVAPRVEHARRQREVIAGRNADGQRQAQGIRAVLLDQLERILHVALDLAHLDPAVGANQTIQIHRVERRALGELQAEHDHSRDPEEQDVVARLHDRRRVERAQISRIFGPAERAEGPQP